LPAERENAMKLNALNCAVCGQPMRETYGDAPHCPRCVSTGITTQPPPYEDDDKPYNVAGDDEHQPCLNCRKPLPRGALLCNHCGFNQETGETLERVYKKVDKQWEAGLRFQTRFTVFLALTGSAFLATLIVSFTDGNYWAWLCSWLIGTGLWAFVVGTYARVNLTRSRAGQVRLTKTWRCCFIPLTPNDVRWRGYVGIAISRSGHAEFLDWLALFFLAPWGVVPAILWWYYAIRPDQLDVTLTKEHGVPAMLLYRGQNEAMAKGIVATIRSVTGLP
jgi:hypothetical protein